MLLCRVALGLEVRSFDGDARLNDGGPVWAQPSRRSGVTQRIREFAYVPITKPPMRYQSLVIVPNSRVPGRRGVTRFKEYVVTHAEQCYLEYVLGVWGV